MRTIDADALKKHIDKLPALPDGNFAGNHSALKALINMQPTIEPDRKKGKWLPDNNNYYEERFICSVCGKSYKVDTCMGKPMWDFCPCGADMRQKEEGNV